MKVYPRKYRAMTLNGNNVFPIYSVSGGLMSGFMAVIFDGESPDSIDLGIDDLKLKVNGDARYVVIRFVETIGESRLAQKVEQAEQLIENSK